MQPNLQGRAVHAVSFPCASSEFIFMYQMRIRGLQGSAAVRSIRNEMDSHSYVMPEQAADEIKHLNFI